MTTILESVKAISSGLHEGGTFSPRTLDAIVKHATRRHILHSAETGCGASTLLLSQLSDDHTVFALDCGNGSVNNVLDSVLLRKDVVKFVSGPTQETMPAFLFRHDFDLVLLDGPHGYPFPELEYYFIYPHLAPGSLLIVDDIQIRTIHNLFSFLKVDAMFHLDEVVNTTAFFTRTSTPTFDPRGDGWWDQRYNERPAWPYLARHFVKKLLGR